MFCNMKGKKKIFSSDLLCSSSKRKKKKRIKFPESFFFLFLFFLPFLLRTKDEAKRKESEEMWGVECECRRRQTNVNSVANRTGQIENYRSHSIYILYMHKCFMMCL